MTVEDRQIQWFVARDGKQHGPLTDAEMTKLVELGHLRPADLVWRYGFADWRPAPSVFPQPEPKPAPAVEPAVPAQPVAAPAASAPREPEAAPAPAAAEVPQAAAAAPAPGAVEAAQAPVPAAAIAPAPAAVPAPQPQPTAAPEADPRQAVATPRPAAMPRPDWTTPRPDFIPRPMPREAAAPAPRPAAIPALRPGTLPVAQGNMGPAPSPAREAAPARRPAFARIAASLLLLGGLVGTAFAGLAYREEIAAFVAGSNAGASSAPDAAAPSAADTAAKTTTAGETNTASLEPPASPPAAQPVAPAPEATAPAAAGQPIATAKDRDAELQTRPLWTAVKQEFPEWYAARIDEAAKLGSEGKSESEITQHLIESLVALRRQNAQPALAASTAKHKAIANAFLANLKQLEVDGADGCYDFISKGETTPTIVARLGDPQKAQPIEDQLLAIVGAIAEGRRQPSAHVAPAKPDYDVLAAELGKLGWTQADMQLFADPRALAQAPHARVCTMLQDWFKAHLEVKDPSAQERLLFETLKPVISG